MSVRRVCWQMAGLAAGLMVTQSSLAQSYMGLGISTLSLSSQDSSIDGRSKTGFTFFGGVEFASTWSVELSVSSATGMSTGPTENIYYPADSAEYGILRLGVRKSFWGFSERSWAPWVTAGTAYHYINWDTFAYQLDGTGVSLGGGADFALARSWRVRVQALRHRFSTWGSYGYGTFNSRSSELSAGVIYAFP